MIFNCINHYNICFIVGDVATNLLPTFLPCINRLHLTVAIPSTRYFKLIQTHCFHRVHSSLCLQGMLKCKGAVATSDKGLTCNRSSIARDCTRGGLKNGRGALV